MKNFNLKVNLLIARIELLILSLKCTLFVHTCNSNPYHTIISYKINNIILHCRTATAAFFHPTYTRIISFH